MENPPSRIARILKTADRARPKHLILAAACFHLLVTSTVFFIGHFKLMPSQFNEVGIGTFAFDGNFYRSEIESLSDLLVHGHVRTWLHANAELHTKLYSLPSAVFKPLTNFNVLTIEPLNNLYYLVILILIFQLARKVFDKRVGILSAMLVAVWPTFLLHTTQLLRDPLVTVALLCLWVVVCFPLISALSWRAGLLLGVMGAVSVVLVWIVRLPMWDVVRATTGLAVLLVVFHQLREKRFMIGNTVGVVLLALVVFVVPKASAQFTRISGQDTRPTWKGKVVPGLSASELQGLPIWERISKRRQGFSWPNEEGLPPGSNLDGDVVFSSLTDIVRFVPRAALVGFFSPFPNTWFAPGLQVGRGGRLLAGFETLLTYIIAVFAAIAIWRNRRVLASWAMFLIVAVGAIGMGLIVINIGTLYRLRYPFWILLVILGSAGAIHLVAKADKKHA